MSEEQQKQATKALDTLRKQVKKYAKAKRRRLEMERDWLKQLPTSGLDDAGAIRKQSDTILVVASLDEFLGR